MMRVFGWLGMTLLCGACAAGGPAQSGPARQGQEVVTAWLSDQAGSTPGKIVYMRNNTDAPVTVTSLTLYECENVRNACTMQQLDVRLQPGEVKEVQRVEARRREQAFRFRYRFGWGPSQ
jgi:hypothetical protein